MQKKSARLEHSLDVRTKRGLSHLSPSNRRNGSGVQSDQERERGGGLGDRIKSPFLAILSLV